MTSNKVLEMLAIMPTKISLDITWERSTQQLLLFSKRDRRMQWEIKSSLKNKVGINKVQTFFGLNDRFVIFMEVTNDCKVAHLGGVGQISYWFAGHCPCQLTSPSYLFKSSNVLNSRKKGRKSYSQLPVIYRPFEVLSGLKKRKKFHCGLSDKRAWNLSSSFFWWWWRERVLSITIGALASSQQEAAKSHTDNSKPHQNQRPGHLLSGLS